MRGALGAASADDPGRRQRRMMQRTVGKGGAALPTLTPLVVETVV